MKSGLLILFSCTMMLCVTSCEEEPIDEFYNVTITFIEPAEGETFNSGDELHMEIDFEREGIIRFVEVLALNETSGDTIFYSGQVDVATENYYAFHEHVDLLVAATSNCKVVASTWEDNPMERISEEVHITVNP